MVLKISTRNEWERSDSNREPRDYESPALTVELRSRDDWDQKSIPRVRTFFRGARTQSTFLVRFLRAATQEGSEGRFSWPRQRLCLRIGPSRICRFSGCMRIRARIRRWR